MTEQEEIIECLQALELREGSHENLSAICAAIYEPMGGWTQGACEGLRHRLVRLLSGVQMPARVGELITGELRTGGIYRFPSNKRVFTEEELLAIADSIDAEHEEALREAYTKGREDGMGMANAKDAHAEYLRGKNDGYDEGYDAGFASADDWCAQHEDAMADHGWIRLPLSEDGEPIRIGELVDERLPFGGYAKPTPVDGMELYRSANGYGWMVKLDAENRALISPKLLRHHKQSTVEDVLREFALAVCKDEALTIRGGVIEEYAAKLRLAGSDGE